MMQRYFIELAYDGTAYHGWQIQPNGNTVQEELMRALATLLRHPVEVTGAGRTDAGVHARLMVAHFDESPLDTVWLTDKLNRLLPQDISIYAIRPVRPEAHARFSATSRTYHYFVHQAKSPFHRGYSWRVVGAPLDFHRMNEAAKTLFDYTDFTSFSKLHTDVKTNNCRIMQAEWQHLEEDRWVFVIRADRFLRNMVRAVVGTLIEVGRGRMSVEEFRQVIERRDRCSAGESVPGHALFLTDVTYPEELYI